MVAWCSTYLTEEKYGGVMGLNALAYAARHSKTQAGQIAARRVMRARRMDFSRSGRPKAHDDLEGLLDRDLGKAAQSLTVETVHTRAEAEGDLLAQYRANPELLPEVIARLADALPGLRVAILERLSPKVLVGPSTPLAPSSRGGGTASTDPASHEVSGRAGGAS